MESWTIGICGNLQKSAVTRSNIQESVEAVEAVGSALKCGRYAEIGISGVGRVLSAADSFSARQGGDLGVSGREEGSGRKVTACWVVHLGALVLVSRLVSSVGGIRTGALVCQSYLCQPMDNVRRHISVSARTGRTITEVRRLKAPPTL